MHMVIPDLETARCKLLVMSTPDDFTHHLAIKLSRVLNIVNPNDLLARRVIDIAKTNQLEGFAKGTQSMPARQVLVSQFCLSGEGFWQVSRSFFS